MRIERFEIAVLDENGVPTKLFGSRELQATPTLDGGSLPTKIKSKLFDERGDPVNPDGPGKYVGVVSGKRYTDV